MTEGNSLLVQQARSAIKAGQKQQARQLLQQAVRQDPQNHAAWLWLASIATSPRTSLEYISRAEMLQPDDPTIRRARAWAERRLRAAEQPTNQVTRPPRSQPRWPIVVLWSGLSLALIAAVLLAGFMVWTVWNQTPLTVASDSTGSIVFRQALNEPAPLTNNEPAPLVAAARATIAPTPTPFQLQAKVVGDHQAKTDGPRPTWTLTPMPTDTPTPTPTPLPTMVGSPAQAAVRPYGVGPSERWININLGAQTLTAYEGDTAVMTARISSGTWRTPTVTGQFRVYLRYESQTMDGRRLGYNYYLENVPYVMYFYRDYAIHGTYWHNNFGTPMSHGCVNMKTSEAAWLYNWASIGTFVNVHH